MAAASARQWETALTEYVASNTAASSIVALDGLANAHYQLHHDREASAAYAELLKTNAEIPKGQTALEQEWTRMRTVARDRMAEIAARGAPAASAPVEATPPAEEEEDRPRRRRARDDDQDDGERVRTAQNAVFAEIAGNAFVYSVNYERLFGDTGFTARLGFSYMSLGASAGNASTSVTWVAVPILGNYLVGGENHKLQLGLGATMLYVTTTASSGALFGSVSGLVPVPTAALGYRYVPARGGFTLFVGLTPFIIPGGDKTFLPWGGLSLGGVF
jgi:hypothetical protein